MRLNRNIALAAILVAQLGGTAWSAQNTGNGIDVNALLQRIGELEQKVKVLDRNRELGEEVAVEKAKTAATVSIGASGFAVRSANTNFILKIRGYAQVDARFYPNDNSTTATRNDTVLIRRLRPIFEGTVYDKFDYRIMLDFPSGVPTTAGNNALVQDVYVNYRPLPQFQIQAGKFKQPAGLERLQSGANLLFVERGYPTQLVPNRDVGVQVQGDLFGVGLRYDAGVFNGAANGGSGDNEQGDDEKDLAARLFATPFVKSDNEWLRGMGFGIAGTVGNQSGALRSVVTPGQQSFFAYLSGARTAAAPNAAAKGQIWRTAPQAYYYKGAFGIVAEYVVTSQEVTRTAGPMINSARLRNSAWQVAASWFVTGEDNSSTSVTPLKPFNLGLTGWGALEVTARFGELDVVDANAFPLFASDTTSASKAASWGVSMNWHLNRNIKLSLNHEQTDFSGGSNAFLNNGEQVLLTRAQFSF